MTGLVPAAPLFIVAGAPGAGKTTVLPRLLEFAGALVVMEMDEVLEDGSLLGVPIAKPDAEPVWPAYNRMWRRIVAMVRRAGHPVLLLTPTPSPDEVVVGGAWPEPVHWALLDCDDRARASRLRARSWSEVEIDEALRDADQAREVVKTVISSDVDPGEIARRVLAWVEEVTDRTGANRPCAGDV